ncbi:uncharacterized protein LY79DRAFT_564311 [Colletotrichum navitas]|uniref:Uncharacterized protein n=1 Tax=Colletotrichum navitas TaxID=681940 RepID=A0AAD8V146_9PEZI|nr:uncharacterized protein LY79DRAFT_564311 [Colletotrichum navitas]KAK1579352.1 hypothetical protein LY79DRAFT_564311 [Colletotrichum navitas]
MHLKLAALPIALLCPRFDTTYLPLLEKIKSALVCNAVSLALARGVYRGCCQLTKNSDYNPTRSRIRRLNTE